MRVRYRAQLFVNVELRKFVSGRRLLSCGARMRSENKYDFRTGGSIKDAYIRVVRITTLMVHSFLCKLKL